MYRKGRKGFDPIMVGTVAVVLMWIFNFGPFADDSPFNPYGSDGEDNIGGTSEIYEAVPVLEPETALPPITPVMNLTNTSEGIGTVDVSGLLELPELDLDFQI